MLKFANFIRQTYFFNKVKFYRKLKYDYNHKEIFRIKVYNINKSVKLNIWIKTITGKFMSYEICNSRSISEIDLDSRDGDTSAPTTINLKSRLRKIEIAVVVKSCTITRTWTFGIGQVSTATHGLTTLLIHLFGHY